MEMIMENQSRSIDLNCDMGESEDEGSIARDIALMGRISSVNIACGFHAGNPRLMSRLSGAAFVRGIAVGAHPSFLDRENFGRSSQNIPEREAFDMVVYQVSTMQEICRSHGGSLSHVKPHGALYNQAASDELLAAAIAAAVRACGDDLILYGLSGSVLLMEAEKIGVQTASEVFSDRTYRDDGSLTPRNEDNALIRDAGNAAEQVEMMVEKGLVKTVSGSDLAILAETVCIHGDGPDALGFASAIAELLSAKGIKVSSPARRPTNL